MLFFYRLTLLAYQLAVKVLSLFSLKARQFVQGRRQQAATLAALPASEGSRIWFHFPSLGEFEQGRPVLEAWKTRFPGYEVLVTFFSPSGYEARKNYSGANWVFYLPMDGKKRSLETVQAFDPALAVFTKYDFWYYYFSYLHERQVPVYVISAIFRPGQIFFKPWGSLFRKTLRNCTWIFLQDEASSRLLEKIGLSQMNVTGDTRFDRVAEVSGKRQQIPGIAAFVAGCPVLVAGSTWEKDEHLIAALAVLPPAAGWKFIVAPHEIDRCHTLESTFGNLKTLRYSALETAAPGKIKAADVLLIDNIGMLSSLYGYGHMAYIGGGFGSGIHNTLEAGAYGIPVVFGPVYGKFKEARDMVLAGAAISITDIKSLENAFITFSGEAGRSKGKLFEEYVKAGAGATQRIISAIAQLQGLGDTGV